MFMLDFLVSLPVSCLCFTTNQANFNFMSVHIITKLNNIVFNNNWSIYQMCVKFDAHVLQFWRTFSKKAIGYLDPGLRYV